LTQNTKLAGAVNFHDFQFLYIAKNIWQHNQLIDQWSEDSYFRKCDLMNAPSPHNMCPAFEVYYNIEIHVSRIMTLSRICEPYVTGYGKGLYDENTDFEALIRNDLYLPQQQSLPRLVLVPPSQLN
jgi:hypothetical protein